MTSSAEHIISHDHTALEPLCLIKIGGNILDDDKKLAAFLDELADLPGRKILVHGGGKKASRLATALGHEQRMVDGRRITDEKTLEIVTMVYAGYINKQLVAGLQERNCNALGLSGADGNLIRAHKRVHPTVDYGFAGDIDEVNADLLDHLLLLGMLPVIAPITHDRQGQVLNTNADTIAQELAKALASRYAVQLVYSFEKSGVLMDVDDESSVIPTLTPAIYQKLKAEEKIFAGMIPKLDNAFAALQSGVRAVTIGKAEELTSLLAHRAGTKIIHESN